MASLTTVIDIVQDFFMSQNVKIEMQLKHCFLDQILSSNI